MPQGHGVRHGIGEPVPRKEDLRLLTGTGRFSDDVSLPGQAYAAILRSPHAHARIEHIDTAPARAAPGVLAVLTIDDYLADGLGGITYSANPADAVDTSRKAFRDGAFVFETVQFPLAHGTVRHVGEPVALVVAETEAVAAEAAALITVDYEPLAAVVGVADAVAPDAPRIHGDAPGNLCLDAQFGDRPATDAAFADAAHIVEGRFVNNRMVNAQLEPRAALGEFDGASGVHTLHAGSQISHRLKGAVMRSFDLPPDKVRVICGDVGGGFGPRTVMYPEFVLVLWAARRLGCPVKWTGDRSEAFVSDFQARDLLTEAALALDGVGRILALRSALTGNIGGYPVSYVPLANGVRLATTVYDIPLVHIEVKAVLTNTLPVIQFRGAGRPEAMYVMERLLDLAAEKTGIDRVELRRRNLITPGAMPYLNANGLTYDCGAFEAIMDKTLALADWDGFAARRAESKARGRYRGIGIANYIEAPVGAPMERAEITIEPSGMVKLVVGTQSTGQGHETSFAQVLVDRLGIPFDAVNLITGDTDVAKIGGGSHSDRSIRLAGTMMVRASDEILETAKTAAAHILEAAESDLEFAQGRFAVAGTDRAIDLFGIARALADGGLALELPDELAGAAEIREGRIPAYPNGCAVCEVEIDFDTGVVVIDRYTTVDDVGTVINPLIVDGQVHGGIAQGVGQALFEDCIYDADTGQLASGSFLDYCLPRADDLPSFRVETFDLPSAGKPLGVKGGGEGGTTPALGAVINAVCDALSGLGVRHMDMPATPERVWRAIEAAKRR
jgi:carbon-monoxide dehydrogenase large subunit